jgi:hypothetical protein
MSRVNADCQVCESRVLANQAPSRMRFVAAAVSMCWRCVLVRRMERARRRCSALSSARHGDLVLLAQPSRALLCPNHPGAHPAQRFHERARPGERDHGRPGALQCRLKPFIWTAPASAILEKVARAKQVSESQHQRPIGLIRSNIALRR